MSFEGSIALERQFFSEKEKSFVDYGALKAATFVYERTYREPPVNERWKLLKKYSLLKWRV